MIVSGRLGLRARSEKPGLLGRAHWSREPRRDREEARLCGAAAVRAACNGSSGVMVTLVRDTGARYSVSTALAPLDRVAYVERLFPGEWRNTAGNDILPGFAEWARPLVGAIRHYRQLS